jgi:fatty-acyl-CoA synthase
MTKPAIPSVTLEQFETEYRDLHLVHAAADRWAASKPNDVAILNATRGSKLTWAELRQGSVALAAELAALGLRKGDFLAASLPLLNEHLLLEFACFRLGVIHVPLDLRLQPTEVLRCLALVRPKAYAFLGKTASVDFSALGEVVREKCDFVEHLIQFSAPADCIAGAKSFGAILAAAMAKAGNIAADVTEHDGAQVIFTTGSTGSPKPALLSHRGITCQNLCLGTAFFQPGEHVLCNLPASHVGGQAELLLTTLFMGGSAVTLEIFDPVVSLDAVEKLGATLVGQIPAMFQMEWRTAGYAERNLQGLRAAVYGGQAVPKPFVERMLQMAPVAGTGLGLTETSGFCTYTELSRDAATVARSIGWSMPAYPLTIRGEMKNDGSAGDELGAGAIGHVCFQGPQTFLGYVNDPEATARTLSSDGYLYTGDIGYVDEAGLHFSGRAKWVIKPSGYQVFPGDVESHIAALEDKVANVGVVGYEHRLWSEGIIAFVEKRPGVELTDAELKRHARSLTSYMRPLHYVVLEPGTMPLNRIAKVDVTALQERAKEEVRALRERGRWDRESLSQ